MSGWGVLVTADADGGGEGAAALADRMQGVVVVHDGVVGSARPTALDYLRGALDDVPADVRLVALVDDEALSTQGADAVPRMIAGLAPHEAGVVRAVPVTDALKLVEGDRVRGSVDRTGLFVPGLPQVLRRDLLVRALAEAPAALPSDPATLLIRQGHRLGVVWGAAPTVAARMAAGLER